MNILQRFALLIGVGIFRRLFQDMKWKPELMGPLLFTFFRRVAHSEPTSLRGREVESALRVAAEIMHETQLNLGRSKGRLEL